MKFEYKEHKVSLLKVYLFVAFLVWSFFLALALAGPEQDVVENVGYAILGGGLVALIWPLIVMAKLMHMILL